MPPRRNWRTCVYVSSFEDIAADSGETTTPQATQTTTADEPAAQSAPTPVKAKRNKGGRRSRADENAQIIAVLDTYDDLCDNPERTTVLAGLLGCDDDPKQAAVASHSPAARDIATTVSRVTTCLDAPQLDAMVDIVAMLEKPAQARAVHSLLSPHGLTTFKRGQNPVSIARDATKILFELTDSQRLALVSLGDCLAGD